MQKLTNIVLVALILIGCAQLVSASTPQFSKVVLLEQSNFTNEQNQLFAQIVFTPQPYLADVFVKTTIEDFTVQRFDELKWNGAESIVVRKPNGDQRILTNASENYNFENIGSYTWWFSSNESNTRTIIVNNPPTNNIILSTEEVLKNNVRIGGFSFTYTPQNFNLESTERVVQVRMDVNKDVLHGNYVLKYNINNEQLSRSFNIQEVVNWTMNTTNITNNITAKSGDITPIGRVMLENTGNVDTLITITKKGTEAHMISVPQPQNLYRLQQLFIDLQLQVPLTQKTGEYNITIEFKDKNNQVKEFVVPISVKDSTPPIIESIEFESDRAFIDNKITVVATDNTEVSMVTMKYLDGKIENFTKDANLFTKTVQFIKLSQYVLEFCAHDNDGNIGCEQVNKTFSKLDIINPKYERVITLPSVKYGKFSQYPIITLDQDLTVGITLLLLDLTSSNRQTTEQPVVRIVDEKGAIKVFDQITKEVRLTSKGKYFLEVRSDQIADYEGIVRTEVPEYVNAIQDITFKVSFKEYDIPQSFTREWIGGRIMECEVVDTGNLDTSYYNCQLPFSINTRAEDISVPTTISERDTLKNEANKVLEKLESNKTKYGFIITAVVVLLLVTLLIAWYMYTIHPYMRVKVNVKRD